MEAAIVKRPVGAYIIAILMALKWFSGISVLWNPNTPLIAVAVVEMLLMISVVVMVMSPAGGRPSIMKINGCLGAIVLLEAGLGIIILNYVGASSLISAKIIGSTLPFLIVMVYINISKKFKAFKQQ